MEKLFFKNENTTIDDWGHLTGVLAHCYCITRCILDHRNHIKTHIWSCYNITETEGYSECKLRICNHCFVGIFYDDVFTRIMLSNIVLIHFLPQTVLSTLISCVRDLGPERLVWKCCRDCLLPVNDYWHVCTHVQYLNRIIQILSDISNHTCFDKLV